MRRVVIACALMMVVLTGCEVRFGVAGPVSKPHAAAKASQEAARGSGTGTGGQSAPSGNSLTVLVEPKNGVAKIYQIINGAKSSIELTMYELKDQTAESDLAAAAARGVDVRVILDQHLEKSRNTATYDYLSHHHVHVTWADAGTTYHQKTLTVDGKVSVVMTLNMVSSDYAGTRDFAVIDTQKADIDAIVTTFDADFAHKAITPPDGADLVWSPTNSQATILDVINSATRTLSVENEEMASSKVISALESAAERGVDVEVVMTAESEWDKAFGELVKAGVHVRLYRDSSKVLYIHAKAIVADAGRKDQQVFVGSENFSTASMDYNRELGIRTTSGGVISVINATLAADYAGATPYSG